jgi:hypothetical protein
LRSNGKVRGLAPSRERIEPLTLPASRVPSLSRKRGVSLKCGRISREQFDKIDEARLQSEWDFGLVDPSDDEILNALEHRREHSNSVAVIGVPGAASRSSRSGFRYQTRTRPWHSIVATSQYGPEAEVLQALRLTILCPGRKSLVSRQPVLNSKPSHLVVSKDLFSGLDTIRIVKAASNNADLVAHRTGKGERATTTWTEAPLHISRRSVFRQTAPGPKQIVCVKHNKNKEGRTGLPLTLAAVAVSYPKRIAPALKAKVSA